MYVIDSFELEDEEVARRIFTYIFILYFAFVDFTFVCYFYFYFTAFYSLSANNRCAQNCPIKNFLSIIV